MKLSSRQLILPVILASVVFAGWCLVKKEPVAISSSSEETRSERARKAYYACLKADGVRPPAAKTGAQLTAEELLATQNSRPTLRTSLLDLDLSRPPSEKELIHAGQLGDPLSPTGLADPVKIMDQAARLLQERDNLAFGKAIQSWNAHQYDAAVAMFAQHLEDFPDSPWAAESKMHIGCAAQYRGQYDVSYQQFGSILDSTPVGSDSYQKAMLRTANIQTMQGQFEEAAATYREAMKTETDPKRLTYASSWLPVLALYKQQQTALRDCVQKSLKEICLLLNKPADAEKVAAMQAMHESGFTAAQVLEVCKMIGMEAEAVRVLEKDPAVVATPYLAHYKDEHFVAVLGMSQDKVRVYDSRVGFQNEIPLSSFSAQWSGTVISLSAHPHSDHRVAALDKNELNTIIGGCCGVLAAPAKYDNSPNENTPCATGPSGEPGKNPWLDAPPTDDRTSAMASPSWAVNPVSMNMIVRDVPLWWDSPYGLDVRFTLSYNSLDTLNAIRPFGDKWVLNYCAYAMEDPSGKVTIVAGNGNQWAFTPKVGGGYDAPTNFPCVLVKTGTYEFELTHQETDTVFRYGRPAGVSTSASLFLSATDKWGVSVTMGHNSNGALTTVTHSIGGVWSLIYNTDGKIERIDDPFGRSAYMAYDTAGALREVTDMGGMKYAFRYSTSANPVNATTASQVLMTEIVYAPEELPTNDDANRTWHSLIYRFLTEPSDATSAGMWSRYRITTTQNEGGSKVYYYDGVSKGFLRNAAQVAAGNDGTSYTYTLANAEGQLANLTYPGGGTASMGSYNSAAVPLSITQRNGVVLTQTVNSFERPLTITDPSSRVTTLEYESNGMDLKKVTGPDSVVASQITYNANRQPASITNRDGTQTVMTYNSHGQPLTTTFYDATSTAMQVTTYTYNTADLLASVDVDGRTIASYTYDSIGRTSTVSDQDSITLTYTYDNLNRVTKVTYPDSTFNQVVYHPITGMLDWAQGRDGGRTLYFYDKRGYRIATNEPGQRFTFWNYDNDGNLILLIDPKGNRTTWEYDVEGRLIKKTLQDGALEQYAWNTKSQLTQQTSPRGMKRIFTYDTLGRVSSTAYQDNTGTTAFPTESVTYDVLDRMATTVDGEGTTTYSYDTAARLSSVDGPYGGDTVSYTYDDSSRISTITTPGSITQSFTYDSDKRLSTWTDIFGSGSMTYSGRTGRVTGISRAGGTLTSSYAYTASSDLFKLSQIKHQTGSSVISQFDYTWNARQDLATWTRTLGSTADRNTQWTFGHDAAHQLISATLRQVSTSAVVADQRWGFDTMGNRTLEHDLVTDVRTEYSHNNTNQLVDKKTYSSGQKPWMKGALNEPGSVGLGGNPVPVKGDNSFEGQSPSRTTTVAAKDTAGNTTTENWQLNSGSGSTADATLTYTHDSEGNLLGDGTSTFEWDLRNRLTAIVTGTHRTEYTYDGSDRRVRVVEKDSGTTTSDKRYVFNGLSILEERASDNSTVLRRFYGDGHVDIADSGKRYAYTKDHLGSIREVMLLDGTSGDPTTATLAARYDYDLWGKRTVLDGGTTAETLVLHGYTGHVYHQQSGLWLAPYRAYMSGIARWISRDPVGESGGINLYAYCENRPLTRIDPDGKIWAQVAGAVVGAGLAAWSNYDDWQAGKLSNGQFWGTVGLGAGAGVFATLGGGIVGGSIMGGIAAGANSAGSDLIKGEKVNVPQAALSAGLGALGGFAAGSLAQAAASAKLGLKIPGQIGKPVGSPESLVQHLGEAVGIVADAVGNILGDKAPKIPAKTPAKNCDSNKPAIPSMEPAY